MAVDWPRLAHLIESHDRFMLTSHVRPDGDAIGSLLGMAAILAQKGKQCRIVSAGAVPARYQFLDPRGHVEVYHNDLAAGLADIQVLVVLDTSSWAQLGGVAQLVRTTSAKKVVIDHHVGHDEMGAELFQDTRAAACGAILAEAVDHLGCTMTSEIAEPLFVALATDTGWFRFGSTNGHTLRLVARLVDSGLAVDRLYRTLFEESSLARLRLLGRTLQSLRVVASGRMAYGSIRLADLDATGAIAQDTEDMVNYTLAIRGIEVGVMFVEQHSGSVKVSFRSRNDLDCTRVAARFGGGGHRQAAGATIALPLAQAEAQVVQAVEQALAQPNSPG